MNRLIFFDINGTLIKRDERTDIPYKNAIDILLNVKDGMKGVDTSARSDKDVFIEVLEKHKISFTEEKWTKFLDIYIEQLEDFKNTDVWRNTYYSNEILDMLSNANYKLSLITGELKIGAKYKLSKIGVWNYFKTGGFGEDGLRRFDIAETALNKAKELFGNNFNEVYVIGDTILDIKTARHLGAKIISVTTGSNTRSELEKENPDFIIDSLKELENILL